MFDLTGKTALITGHPGGIGGARRQGALHGQGAAVVPSRARAADPLDALAAELGAPGPRADRRPLRQAQVVEALRRKRKRDWGWVDILVNNAGVTRDHLMMRMKDDEWSQVMRGEPGSRGHAWSRRAGGA